jgi:2-polyprenyl-6-methoxyphenol hydroxylase-like FAD-dependent oxidoreductase
MTVNPRRALIIGGGVAGPVLALFLKRSGSDAQVFEASSGPADTGGALGLAANGMNVLAAAGVIEQVRDVSVGLRVGLRKPARQAPRLHALRRPRPVRPGPRSNHYRPVQPFTILHAPRTLPR